MNKFFEGPLVFTFTRIRIKVSDFRKSAYVQRILILLVLLFGVNPVKSRKKLLFKKIEVNRENSRTIETQQDISSCSGKPSFLNDQ